MPERRKGAGPPVETFSLTVDGKTVEVPAGTMLLTAARKLGAVIPTFCDHPLLKPHGSCRMCVVEVEGSDRLFASCVTPAAPGMVVRTDTARVRAARQTVLELILAYHPLDCPVCPQSGRCLLQDMVFTHGLAAGRFGPVPVDKKVDTLSPLIEMNQNRCILCGRCVRICDEVQGEGHLDFIRRGFNTVVEPAFGHTWDCEFCGQCYQACPVGALYSRVFKHTARLWELTDVRTTCPFCGVGCTIRLETRLGRIHHVLGDEEKGAVNTGFLCSKGRFGYEFVRNEGRLLHPLIRRDGRLEPTSWEEALSAAARGLADVVARKGPHAVGGIISPRASNEEAYLLQKFMRAVVGTNNVDSASRFTLLPALSALRRAFGLAASTGTIGTLASSDLILVLEANLTEDNHVAGLFVLRRVREGKSSLITVHSRGVKIARFARTRLRPRPGKTALLVEAMVAAILEEGKEDKEFLARRAARLEEMRSSLAGRSPEAVEERTGVPAAAIREAARAFAEAKNATIILAPGAGSPFAGDDLAGAAANLALVTGQVGREGAGILVLTEFANSQGVLDMGAAAEFLPGWQASDDPAVRQWFARAWGVRMPERPGLDAGRMMEEAAAGNLSALLVMGEDPLRTFPSRDLVSRALEELGFMVVSDLFLTETALAADVVFPAAGGPEKDGSVTSGDRRVQKLRQAVPTPGEAREGGWILSQLASAMGAHWIWRSAEETGTEIASVVPPYAGILPSRLETGGIHWPCTDPEEPGEEVLHRYRFTSGLGYFLPSPPRELARPSSAYPYLLATGTVQHHSGILTTWAPSLAEVVPGARAEIHPRDASALGIASGDWVRLTSLTGTVTVRTSVTDRVLPGMVFLPMHFAEAPAGALVDLASARAGLPVFVAIQRVEGPPASLREGEDQISRLREVVRSLHGGEEKERGGKGETS